MGMIGNAATVVVQTFSEVVKPIFYFMNDTLGINDFTVSLILVIIVFYLPITTLFLKYIGGLYSPIKATIIDSIFFLVVPASMYNGSNQEEVLNIFIMLMFVAIIAFNTIRFFMSPVLSGITGRDRD